MPTSTGTYDTIASFVLTQGLQSVAFSNLPQNYQTLILTINGKYTNSSQSYCRFYVNGLKFGQYQVNSYALARLLPNSGTPVVDFSSQSSTWHGYTNITPDAGTISLSTEMTAINYNNYNGNKAFIFDSRMNSSIGGYGGIGISTIQSQMVVDSFELRFDSGTFAVGTSFALYGLSTHQIKATGGDVIATDGNYWYHTFKSSGTFTPVASMTADILVVGGGAGGGAGKGAGGGGGGVCYLTGGSLTAGTSYTAIVGAGNAGGNLSGAPIGINGSNSTFFGITANGGGGGGSDYISTKNGNAGGSGGGATRDGTVGAANQGTSGGATGYGNAGGAGSQGTNGIYGGGGGGGAGAAGGSPTTSGTRIAGAGGAGKNTWSGWLDYGQVGNDGYIAGGGGGSSYGSGVAIEGGNGGAGGGGDGATYDTVVNSSEGLPGVVNTGGGGGGGSDGGRGGAGGSGVVIVRYTV
jgi:hypothetical protein